MPPPATVLIRRFERKDAPAVRALFIGVNRELAPTAMREQFESYIVQSLREDPPNGIVVDLSQVNYFGSVFVSFLLRCHALAKKNGSEIVLAGASEPARELLHLLDLETLWALYGNRQEAIEALSSD